MERRNRLWIVFGLVACQFSAHALRPAGGVTMLCRRDFTTSPPTGTLKPVVQQCASGLFRVSYPEATDVPDYIVTAAGQVKATCGGMPLPTEDPLHESFAKECDLKCGADDLCKSQPK